MTGLPRAIKNGELQDTAVVIDAETIIGEKVDVRNYNTMIVYFDYTKGDETSFELIPKFLQEVDGEEHQLTQWSNDAAATITQQSFKLTATAKSYIVLDVRGLNIVKIYGDATAGTPTGTVKVGYTLQSE